MDLVTDRIRNVALVGHDGNGKTTLAEALLFRAGVLQRMGSVEAGTTASDTDDEERRRGQSLSATLLHFTWGDCHVNLLDTPGYADFTGEVQAAMRVADLLVFVVDAVAGVQSQDERLWRMAAELDKPRLIFVNKMDRERADFDRTLDQIRERFSPAGIEPVELPIGQEAAFHGVADLITEHVWLYDSGRGEESDDLPPEVAEREHAEHEHLVEDVVEHDDALLERYLDGEVPGPADLERALHDGVDRAVVFPVLVGSAAGPVAVDRLAEFITHVGPAPTDVPAPMAEAGGDVVEIPCDASGSPVAFVFKTVTDPYVGQLSYFKVLSGTVAVDDTLIDVRTGDKHRLHGLVRVRGAEQEPLHRVVAGDIAAVTKLTGLDAGDTLAPDGLPVRLPPIERPEPVHGVAIAAATQTDEDKLAIALQKVLHEDPSLVVEHDDETHQTILRGVGDTQVQVTLERIERRHGVKVVTQPVKIAYRETLRQPVEVEGRHKKQSGGRGQFGVVQMRFEPLERGTGFEFVDAVVGGAVPKGLIPAVEKGIVESMRRGGARGFPVVDLRATLVDGKYHSVDSDEASFKMAGSLALRAALQDGGTAVLEPISSLEIAVPSELQGDVIGDLNSRRGQVTGTQAGPGPGEVTILATAPASELVSYATDIRSMTHGRGRFRASFDHYEELSPQLADKLPSADQA
ncbi:MAG TPA: elongation factor G [Acidimicrobiales bacterium]|nr:elongation factor G [Acidimicrobiales bacterium]